MVLTIIIICIITYIVLFLIKNSMFKTVRIDNKNVIIKQFIFRKKILNNFEIINISNDNKIILLFSEYKFPGLESINWKYFYNSYNETVFDNIDYYNQCRMKYNCIKEKREIIKNYKSIIIKIEKVFLAGIYIVSLYLLNFEERIEYIMLLTIIVFIAFLLLICESIIKYFILKKIIYDLKIEERVLKCIINNKKKSYCA